MTADPKPELWLAPLRGVTIRAFRTAFAEPIREAGFAGAFAPFIPANPGLRVHDRMLADLAPFPPPADFPLIPQVITKDAGALRDLLKGLKARGFARADLNAGCPFPMIRRRGRGAGLFRAPDVLERLLAAGCDEMGPGRFSLKTRLGLERTDELLALMPRINRYPLAVLTVHARTAHQMYTGVCDLAAFASVAAASTNPVMYNGDWAAGDVPPAPRVMVGRSFIRSLGAREDVDGLLGRYIDHDHRWHACPAIELKGFDVPGCEVKKVRFKDVVLEDNGGPAQDIQMQHCRDVSFENITVQSGAQPE